VSFATIENARPGTILWQNQMPMTTPVPFEVFSPELLPGETIQWTGRPNPSVVFHPEDAFMIPFSLMWGGFAIFWLLGASGIANIFSKPPDRPFQWFGVIWGTPFVVVGQYMIWGRFVYASWLKKRTYYAITNRRALIVADGLRGRNVTATSFGTLPTIDKRVRSDGIGSIAFGGPVTGEWRSSRNNTPRPPTFDDVGDADAVYQIAIRMQDQNQRESRSGDSRFPQ
jgi:hypothetical protein